MSSSTRPRTGKSNGRLWGLAAQDWANDAKRVAKPGSPILLMTWGEPDRMGAAELVTALKPLLPPPPPRTLGPFALSGKGLLEAFATDSGLRPVKVFDVASPWYYPDLETALRGLGSAGVAAKAIENTSREEVDAVHRRALSQFVKADGSYEISVTFRCLVAQS